MNVKLADKLYREIGLVSIIENGRLIGFADCLEKEKTTQQQQLQK